MPDQDAAYQPEYPEGDYFPTTQAEYDKIKGWALQARSAARKARQPYEPTWLRSYRMYDSWVAPRRNGEWRSRVFMPESFQTVETILPRLIANLPAFRANPFGPEDVANSEVVTRELEFCRKHQHSRIEIEQVDMNRDRLIYGTGILKTFHRERKGFSRQMVPTFETRTEPRRSPLIGEDGLPLLDPDGEQVFDEQETSIQIPTGFALEKVPIVKYDGPAVKCIDPFDFWPAPEAEDVESARYVIHRSRPELSDVIGKMAEGIYHWPKDFESGLEPTSLFGGTGEEPVAERQDSIDMGPGADPTRRQVVLEEIYTDDNRLITLMNGRVVIRVQENPYDHAEKPFVIFYDYKKSHEFWGKGEIEVISGIQDLINALVNQRIDNVRLGMDQGWVVNTSQIKDPRQLVRKPGQKVEITGDGMSAQDVMWPMPTTEVTQSAFAEADQAKQWSERATSVSAYQTGGDSSSLNDTATGVSIISELGSSRFAVKSKVDELDPYKRLAHQLGMNLQQFTTWERHVKLLGPAGEVWQKLDPLSLGGAFDFTIDVSSTQQSETMRREQALTLIRELAPLLVSGQPLPPPILELIKKVLEAFDIKDVENYLPQAPNPMDINALMAASQQAPMQPQVGQPQ